MGSGLFIQGPAGSLDEIRANQKDGKATYETGIYIFAACESAIRIRGAVQQAAIDFWQPGGNPQRLLWRGATHNSALHARPSDGDFVFEGGNLDYQNHGGIKVRGLSGTAEPAKNLRGIGIPVPVGDTQITISFPVTEKDAAYGMMVECSWLSAKCVANKTPSGFTVKFAQAAPQSATLDWLLVR
jgi:hypothetical protein